MPRGSFFSQQKTERKKTTDLTALYITSFREKKDTNNELEDKILKTTNCVDFNNYWIANGKTLFRNSLCLNAVQNRGNYNKNKLRLLKKLQERRDKKK